MKAVKLIIRSVLSSAAGIVAFLGTMTAGCDDVDGVPSRKRCRSWFGTPIIEWPGGNWSPILPLLLGIGVGYLTWWLLGFTPLRASTQNAHSGTWAGNRTELEPPTLPDIGGG